MTPWHVDESLMRRYEDGAIDQALAASIETHLVGCAVCRAVSARLADRGRMDETWRGIVDALDRPKLLPLERLLRAIGVREHIARLIGATPSLQASWLLSISLVVAFGTVGAQVGARAVLAFLSVAPLIPLAGIAVAYGPGIDPAYEMGVATPTRGMRLLMLRAGTVLVTSITMMGIASIWLPAGWRSAAWLLPALGLSLSCLALGTWMDHLRAAGVVAAMWVGVLMIAARAGVRGSGPILERLTPFNADGQAASAIVAAVAALVLLARARSLDMTPTREH